MILIDGHNLIPKIHGLSLKMLDDEIELIHILSEYARLSRKKLDVFFDNAPIEHSGTRKFGSITAHFVRKGTTADQAIINRISNRKRSSQKIKVVSSDQKIQRYVKRYQGEVISSEEFAKEIEKVLSTSPSGGKPDPERLSQSEIEHWMALFSENNKKRLNNS